MHGLAIAERASDNAVQPGKLHKGGLQAPACCANLVCGRCSSSGMHDSGIYWGNLIDHNKPF